MGSDTSKTLSPLFCPAQQTGGFLTDLQRAVLWDSWAETLVATEGLLCSRLPVPPSPSFYYPWTTATFLMTLSVTPAYEAKPHESYLCLLPPWSPIPKRNRFQVVVLPKTTHYGPNKSQLKNQNGFKPRPWSNSFLNIAISLSQLHGFHVIY